MTDPPQVERRNLGSRLTRGRTFFGWQHVPVANGLVDGSDPTTRQDRCIAPQRSEREAGDRPLHTSRMTVQDLTLQRGESAAQPRRPTNKILASVGFKEVSG